MMPIIVRAKSLSVLDYRLACLMSVTRGADP